MSQFELFRSEGPVKSAQEVQDAFRQRKQRRWEKHSMNLSFYFNYMIASGDQKTQFNQEWRDPYSWMWDYTYDYMDKPLAGTGVDIYVLDTGLDTNVKMCGSHDSRDADSRLRISYFKGQSAEDTSPDCNETNVSDDRRAQDIGDAQDMSQIASHCHV